MSSDQVMHWHLLLEEYVPTFKYIKGEQNEVADALGRHPTCSRDCSKNNDEKMEFLYSFQTVPEEMKSPLEIKALIKAQNEELQKDKNF